ncbi:MAG: TlpA family protein disulfide reductase [Chloroflexi bacterium]|nr:TlpA family protein disulfide reductase [Chloroflexota bacterium]
MRGRIALIAFGLAFIGAIVALMAWAQARSGGAPGQFAIKARLGEVRVSPEPAPDFTLELFQDGTLTLSSLRGSVVMIDFWASWCPPCRQEAALLEAVYREYRPKGVEFVGVDVWDDPQEARAFIRKFGITYPNGIDGSGKIAIDYGVTGIPEKMFVDREGTLVQRFVGPMNESTLKEVLDGLLSQ